MLVENGYFINVVHVKVLKIDYFVIVYIITCEVKTRPGTEKGECVMKFFLLIRIFFETLQIKSLK